MFGLYFIESSALDIGVRRYCNVGSFKQVFKQFQKKDKIYYFYITSNLHNDNPKLGQRNNAIFHISYITYSLLYH